MTRNELYTYLAAIITTLAETGGSPESMLYILCSMDMDKWQAVRHVLVGSKLVEIKGNYATLTNDGKDMAVRLNAAIRKESN